MFFYFIPYLFFVPIILYYRKRASIARFKKERKGKQNDLLYVKAFNQAANYISTFLMLAPLYLHIHLRDLNNEISFTGIESYIMAWYLVSTSIQYYLFVFVFPELLEKEAEEKYAHIQMKLAL